jgi:hypothetical protein
LTKRFFEKTLDRLCFSCYNNDRKKEREENKMRMYYVNIGGFDFEVYGCEAAYEAFRRACDFAEILGHMVCLVDGETGEVLADNQGDE